MGLSEVSSKLLATARSAASDFMHVNSIEPGLQLAELLMRLNQSHDGFRRRTAGSRVE